MVEPFTAHYVFALGISRFLSCAHWILQVGYALTLVKDSGDFRWIVIMNRCCLK